LSFSSSVPGRNPSSLPAGIVEQDVGVKDIIFHGANWVMLAVAMRSYHCCTLTCAAGKR
jgi:hypothetical protein